MWHREPDQYTCDIARSGGVGEFKMGRRKEMLDIANFGHPLRVRDESLGTTGGGARRRGASLSGPRESFYMDDEGRAVTEMVIDEMPLTEPEEDGDEDEIEGEDEDLTVKPVQVQSRQILTQGQQQQTQTKPQYPPNSQTLKPPSSGLPSNRRPSNASIPKGRSVTSPLPSSSTATKKKAVSKKGSSTPKRSREGEDEHESNALADAIPSWSVPVAKNGNWDEVSHFLKVIEL